MSLEQEFLKGYTLTPAKPRLSMEDLEKKNLMDSQYLVVT